MRWLVGRRAVVPCVNPRPPVLGRSILVVLLAQLAVAGSFVLPSQPRGATCRKGRVLSQARMVSDFAKKHMGVQALNLPRMVDPIEVDPLARKAKVMLLMPQRQGGTPEPPTPSLLPCRWSRRWAPHLRPRK